MIYRAPTYEEPSRPVGRVAELFAGIGGFRIGLARAGWQTVYSNQWEPATKAQHASDVYVRNFGSEGHSNEDIFGVKSIPFSVDMIVGGFPCQDYSVATTLRSSFGLQGVKGVLWWEMLRLISENRPKWVVLENVDRMLKSPRNQRGRDFAVILKSLGMQGYDVEWRVINAAEYGMPQRRRRVFMVGHLAEDSVEPSDSDIYDNGVFAKAFPVLPAEIWTAQIDLSPSINKISETFGTGLQRSPFSNAGVFRNDLALTASVSPDYDGPVYTLGDVLVGPRAIIPQQYFLSKDEISLWELQKSSRKIPRTSRSGHEYLYNQGRMSFPDSKNLPARTVLTSEGSKTPSRFSHTVSSRGRVRRLLPVELERLSGFPDNWTRAGKDLGQMTDARRAFFIGNALVVGVVEKIGLELAQRMES
jgi:DNA (cytosine-5)-methyltransferase 1